MVDVSLKFEDTGLVFILGKSGCGKSTLMNVMGGLDKADSGEIVIMGKSSRDFSATDFLCLFVSEPLNCVRQLQFIKACRRCSVARQNKSDTFRYRFCFAPKGPKNPHKAEDAPVCTT